MKSEVKDVLESNLDVVTKDEVFTVTCSNCRKPLMLLFEKEKSGTLLFKLKVDCPYCINDHSFLKEIYGVMRYLPAPGVQLKNKIDEENNVVRFKTGKV